ncbi:hypothetical protein F0U60_34290 [Archangium minus]|uniref:Translation initiation factor 2 n=1 Tax=Archangium minus TaxID=83450 RepID=A0ABY9WZS4_9BACT|nr:hypothetical protein F0U60_34290 [Archangium minus]
MIAPQTARGVQPGPGRDVIRANQLMEAGLWLHLGGDNEGARNLFLRALSHDPTHRRAREWLAKSEAALVTAPRPRSVSPVAASVAPQPALEVSVVLLDEAEMASPGAEPRLITADVLDFLAEPESRPEAPRPVPPGPVAPRAPAPAPVRAVTPAPVAARAPAAAPAPVRAVAPVAARAPAAVPAPVRAPVPAPVAPRAPAPAPVRAVTPAPVAARAVTPAPVPVATLLQGVEELLSLGDVSSAMELLRKVEQMAPGHPLLTAARERCVRQQQAALEAKLGDLKRVPMLKLRMAELMKLSLDPRAGFLLSRIDGRLSFEALFSVSGMSRPDTIQVLARLLDQDIITIR